MPTARTAAPFGAFLRQYRLAANLTQRALADRAELSERTVSDLERGLKQSPHPSTIVRLADALCLDAPARATLVAAARKTQSQSALIPVLPLVGRVHELTLLDRHLSPSITDDARPALFFAGEPGIGKTRLLEEAATRGRAAGWRVLGGSCTRRSSQEPFTPILTALASFTAAYRPADLIPHLMGCSWLSRLLPELAESGALQTPGGTLPPEQERRLMFAAVRRFLSNIAGPSGTLLALDDLQWSGADALDLVATLIRPGSEKPVRVVGAYRSSEIKPGDVLAVALADFARERLVERAELAPLAHDEAKLLVAGLLDDLPMDEMERSDLVAQLLDRAGGVPFFLMSCARALRTGTPGLSAVERIPWEVAQVIRLRVAALSPPVQGALGAAAVAGRNVAITLVYEVVARPAAEVDAAFSEACMASLLVNDGQDGYQFAHDLVREVIEADLSAVERAALHRRIAETLEHITPPPIERLAYHYTRAGLIEQAIPYLELTGERAAAMYANADAAHAYRELVGTLDGLGRMAESARAREKLGDILATMGRYEDALATFEQARDTYRSTGDREGVCRALGKLGATHADRGTPEEAINPLAVALLSLGTAEPSQGLASLHLALARLYRMSGRYHEQHIEAEQAARIASAIEDSGMLLQAKAGLLSATWQMGRLAEASAMGQELVALAEEHENLRVLQSTLTTIGMICEDRGEFARSKAYFERALAVIERLGDPTLTIFLTCKLGYNAWLSGAWDEARATWERAEALSQRNGPSWVSSFPLVGLGELLFALDEEEAATRYLKEVVQSVEKTTDRWTLQRAQMAMAERDLTEGRPTAALARLEPLYDPSSSEVRRLTALLPLLAWAHLGMGHEERARELAALAITSSREQFDTMGLPTALSVGALVEIRRRRWDEAIQMLDEAIALSRSMPYPYAEAKALYTYSLLHETQGEREQACERFEQALAICYRLGERRYATRVEQALAELSSAPYLT